MSVARFYPYKVGLERLQLALEPLTSGVVKRDDGSLEVFEEQEDLVRIRCDVHAPAGLWDEVLPPEERQNPPTDLKLVCRSEQSRVRGAYNLAGDGLAGTAELEFRRGQWRGKVELQAVVIRTRRASRDLPGYAFERGALLASSSIKALYIDRPEVPGDHLEVRWEKFSVTTRAPKEHLFALDVSGERPVIYLNEDVQGLRNVLDSTGTRGAKARVRDAINFMVAHQVWTSLLGIALAHLAEVYHGSPDNEPEDQLQELAEWEKRVLRDWLPYLYSDQTEHEALESLVKDSSGPEGWRHLMCRVPQAIQDRLRTNRAFEGLLRDCLDSLGEEPQ
jgi:hypothetical protein